MSHTTSCELCHSEGGDLIWRDPYCRVIKVDHPDYPGFCRVVWQAHVQEMTDLSIAEQTHLMHVVLTVEQAIRVTMVPHKVNLASLGNQVPHLHWHVIPRFAGDRHFPEPIWNEAARRKEAEPSPAQHAAHWLKLIPHLQAVLQAFTPS